MGPWGPHLEAVNLQEMTCMFKKLFLKKLEYVWDSTESHPTGLEDGKWVG